MKISVTISVTDDDNTAVSTFASEESERAMQVFALGRDIAYALNAIDPHISGNLMVALAAAVETLADFTGDNSGKYDAFIAEAVKIMNATER